jgi:hypothetical protein
LEKPQETFMVENTEKVVFGWNSGMLNLEGMDF